MPIYEYLCPSCNHEFELRQSFSDKCVVTCPRCQNGAKRLFSPVPIIFKGSGFYVTDHSSKSEIQDSPKKVEPANPGTTSTNATTTNATSTTPAVKTDTKSE